MKGSSQKQAIMGPGSASRSVASCNRFRPAMRAFNVASRQHTPCVPVMSRRRTVNGQDRPFPAESRCVQTSTGCPASCAASAISSQKVAMPPRLGSNSWVSMKIGRLGAVSDIEGKAGRKGGESGAGLVFSSPNRSDRKRSGRIGPEKCL